MEELLELSTDTILDASQQAHLAEVAHKTDVFTIVLLFMVVAANIIAIILLIVLHKQTKRPKNISDRYKSYKTTVGNVVSVEKVAYYIKRYVKKEDLDDNKKKKDDIGIKVDKSPAAAVEKVTENEVVFKSAEQIAKEQEETALEIRKFRYKVFYEFTIPESGNLYTGECYVYDPNAVNPGDILEVTYKPDDPMINFTDYSMPAGFLAK